MYYESSDTFGYRVMVIMTVVLFILPFLLGSTLVEHLVYGIIFIPLSILCNMQTAKRYLIDRSGFFIFRFVGKTQVTFDQITYITTSTLNEISPRVIGARRNINIISIEVKKHNKRHLVSVNNADEFLRKLSSYIDIERINEEWIKTIGEQC